MQSVRLILALFLASLAATSSSPELGQPEKRELVARQDSGAPSKGQGEPIQGDITTPKKTSEDNSSPSSSPDSSSSPSSDDSKPSGSQTSSGKNSQETAKPSESGSSGNSTATDNKDKESKKGDVTTSKPKSTRIPATAQMGYITMKVPAATDGYPLYKIGDTITFEWAYNGLVITPEHINVVAHCSDVAGDFTIASNYSASTTKVEWDTGDAQRNSSRKLPDAATYTLNIYDSAKSVKDNAERGHLQPYTGTQFGMYSPREYKHRDEFKCPTCDPNMASSLDKYTIRMMITMGLIASLSFVWFITGAPL